MAGPPLWLITSDFYPGQGYIRIAKSLETLATWVIPRGKSSGTLAAHTLMRFFFSWDAQVMGFRLACFLLDSLYSVYFSFRWQQSTVPRNHFASLCSTWEHLNTFADGSEPFIFWNKPWILNHLARFLYGSIKYTGGDLQSFLSRQQSCQWTWARILSSLAQGRYPGCPR